MSEQPATHAAEGRKTQAELVAHAYEVLGPAGAALAFANTSPATNARARHAFRGHIAAKNGDIAGLREAIEGTDPNYLHRYGVPVYRSLLYTAAEACRADAVQFLLENGAKVNVSTNGRVHMDWNLLPIHACATTVAGDKRPDEHARIIALLLEHGANINARSGKGTTPLTFAIEGRRWGNIGRLLNAGANAAGDERFTSAVITSFIVLKPDLEAGAQAGAGGPAGGAGAGGAGAGAGGDDLALARLANSGLDEVKRNAVVQLLAALDRWLGAHARADPGLDREAPTRFAVHLAGFADASPALAVLLLRMISVAPETRGPSFDAAVSTLRDLWQVAKRKPAKLIAQKSLVEDLISALEALGKAPDSDSVSEGFNITAAKELCAEVKPTLARIQFQVVGGFSCMILRRLCGSPSFTLELDTSRSLGSIQPLVRAKVPQFADQELEFAVGRLFSDPLDQERSLDTLGFDEMYTTLVRATGRPALPPAPPRPEHSIMLRVRDMAALDATVVVYAMPDQPVGVLLEAATDAFKKSGHLPDGHAIVSLAFRQNELPLESTLTSCRLSEDCLLFARIKAL